MILSEEKTCVCRNLLLRYSYLFFNEKGKSNEPFNVMYLWTRTTKSTESESTSV